MSITPYDAQRLSYQLCDNNNALTILLDGTYPLHSLEIHHNDHDGYFAGESFSPSEKEACGEHVLAQFLDQALAELNGKPKVAIKDFGIAQVRSIANELFDGDSARLAELVSGVDAKFRRLEALESLCTELVKRSPGGCYFLPWAERFAHLGIKASK